MSKVLLLILLGVLIYLVLTRLGRTGGSSGGHQAPREAADIVQCARCGLHFPADDGIIVAAGEAYCCDEHHRLGKG